jgi:hypothetical protein
MSLITAIKNIFAAQAEHSCSCGCAESRAEATPAKITKGMIVREVARRWPQTVTVFTQHNVDFCCGGAHSIEQTARARGCRDIDGLVTDLNRAASDAGPPPKASA